MGRLTRPLEANRVCVLRRRLTKEERQRLDMAVEDAMVRLRYLTTTSAWKHVMRALDEEHLPEIEVWKSRCNRELGCTPVIYRGYLSSQVRYVLSKRVKEGVFISAFIDGGYVYARREDAEGSTHSVLREVWEQWSKSGGRVEMYRDLDRLLSRFGLTGCVSIHGEQCGTNFNDEDVRGLLGLLRRL